MFSTKRITTQADLKADGDEGVLSAVFSTFDIPDSDGDVVQRSTFTDGQPVPMVWSHDWSKPIGKGVVKVEPKRAVFKGNLFMDTTAGLDAYRTIKAMGDLQEYSWGFQIKDAEPGVLDGLPVRYITSAEVFEVSPVLVGANRETYTLSLKSAELKRRLNREQMDRIIAVLLEALTPAEDEDDDPPAADAGKSLATLNAAGVSLLADLDAYASRLPDATDDDLVAAKGQLAALLNRLASSRSRIADAIKRADMVGADDPRELFRQFSRLDDIYRPTSAGRVAVHGGR